MLKEECFGLRIFSLRDIGHPRAKSKIWSIQTKMLTQFPFLRSLFDCEINDWWAHDAFHGWVLSNLNWIKQQYELFTDPPAKLHFIPRELGSPGPDASLHQPQTRSTTSSTVFWGSTSPMTLSNTPPSLLSWSWSHPVIAISTWTPPAC